AIRPETIVPRFELARSDLAPTSAASSAVDSTRTAVSTVKSSENSQTVSAVKTDKTGLAPAPGAAKRIVR
ncbi:MAG: hypothetical protein IJ991_02195, partial [Thermoguttaceae bacterium]|nr:hypothetical protein [Thermoguttaceae bacterium]